MPARDGAGRLEELVEVMQRRQRAGRFYHPCVRAALREIESGRTRRRAGGLVGYLARVAGCSRRTLERWSARDMGVALSRHIRQRGVYRTFSRLVVDPHANIDLVAQALGYTEKRSLTRCWKREVGTTPAFAAAVIRRRARAGRLAASDDETLITAARWVDDAERERERERESSTANAGKACAAVAKTRQPPIKDSQRPEYT